MEQLRQFFRFIIPGGFFIIYCFLFAPLFGIDLSNELSNYKDFSAVIIFLLPAIGFFSSSVHHMVYNYIPFYRINLNRIENEGEYIIQWTNFNVRWRNQSKSKFYSEYERRNSSLTDLMHGNGAILISFIFSIITLSLYSFIKDYSFFICSKEKIVLLFIIIILLFVHIKNYFRTRDFAEEFVIRALQELENENKQ